MLKIYDKDHNAIGHIVKYKDCKIESEVDTGDKTLSFTYLAKHHNLANEMYVRTKEDEYVIKEVPVTTGSFPQIVAVLNLEELQKDMWQTFSVTDTTIDEAVRPVLAGTGWTVGYCDVTKKRNAGMMQVSSLDVIRNLCTAFMCEPVFDTIQKTVSFYSRRGEDKGVYFLAGLNLEKLQRKSTSYDYYTRIIPIGQDGLTIESVNDGKNYLENFQYSDKVLTYIWKDESYTNPQALMEDAELKLEDLSKPTVAYSVDVHDLAAQKPEYSILSYAEGDTVKLIDQETGTMISQRIKKLVRYPDNPEKNTCEIANTFLTFEEMQQKYQDAANIINYTVTGEGRYTGTINVSDILKFEQGIAGSATIGNINSSIVSMQGDLGQVKLALGQVEANYLKAEEADLKYATIENLNVVNQNVHSIQGDYASFKSTVTNELAAHTASIDYLTTHNVTTDYLEANYAAIDLANIEQGCITTAMLGTGIVGTAQIADGSITDAKIVELTANKITAGTLSVERLEIRGSTNSLVYALNDITGALQAQNVDTLNGEILTPRTITADKIVANAITSNEIASKTITANNIAADSITGNEIAANSITGDKIAANSITGSKIAANSIKAANIDTLDLFAQDITATGTIRGVDLIGATGSFSGNIFSSSGTIGGWSLGEYCIYAENMPGELNTSTTVVLQNLAYSLFNVVSCTGANCVVTPEEKQITVVPMQSGTATLYASIPISKGKYIINIVSGYAKSGKSDDRISGSYNYTEIINGETIYFTENCVFEKNTSTSGIQTEYSFEFEIEHDTNAFRIEYTMPSAVQGETYVFSVNAVRNGEIYDPSTPIVNGIPSDAVLAIKKIALNGNGPISIPFYISSSGNIYAREIYEGTSKLSGKYLQYANANGYPGMSVNGNTYEWIRTSANGIIPYQSGNVGNGHGSIGTSSWYFANAYIDSINCKGLCLPQNGTSWIGGKTSTSCIYNVNAQSTSSYHPMMRINSSSGNVWNIGGLADSVGFYGYYASRTANGTDWYTTWNTNTGRLTHSTVLQVNSFIHAYGEIYSEVGGHQWRIGAACGTSDGSKFGFYDATSGGYVASVSNSGTIYCKGEVQAGINTANAFRAVYGNYGFIIRNDGGHTYLMTTKSGDPYGMWNTYITIDNPNCATSFPSNVSVAGTISEGGTALVNKYLRLSGGTITGNLTSSSATGTMQIGVKNNNNNAYLNVTSNAGVYHRPDSGSSTGKWLIYISTSGTVTANTSDRRWKIARGELSEMEAVTILREVPLINFIYKEDAEYNALEQSGIYAQDLRDVLLSHNYLNRGYIGLAEINDNGEGNISYDITLSEASHRYEVDYSKFVPTLWKGWQYHDTCITDLVYWKEKQFSWLSTLEFREETMEHRISEALQKISEQDIEISRQAAEIEYLRNQLQAIA